MGPDWVIFNVDPSHEDGLSELLDGDLIDLREW